MTRAPIDWWLLSQQCLRRQIVPSELRSRFPYTLDFLSSPEPTLGPAARRRLVESLTCRVRLPDCSSSPPVRRLVLQSTSLLDRSFNEKRIVNRWLIETLKSNISSETSPSGRVPAPQCRTLALDANATPPDLCLTDPTARLFVVRYPLDQPVAIHQVGVDPLNACLSQHDGRLIVVG